MKKIDNVVEKIERLELTTMKLREEKKNFKEEITDLKLQEIKKMQKNDSMTEKIRKLESEGFDSSLKEEPEEEEIRMEPLRKADEMRLDLEKKHLGKWKKLWLRNMSFYH